MCVCVCEYVCRHWLWCQRSYTIRVAAEYCYSIVIVLLQYCYSIVTVLFQSIVVPHAYVQVCRLI